MPPVRQTARFPHSVCSPAFFPCVTRPDSRTDLISVPSRASGGAIHARSVFPMPGPAISQSLHGMAPSVLSQKAVRPQNGAICGRERRSFHEIACYQDFTKNNGLFSTKQQNSWKFCLPRADPHEIRGRSARNLNINCPALWSASPFRAWPVIYEGI